MRAVKTAAAVVCYGLAWVPTVVFTALASCHHQAWMLAAVTSAMVSWVALSDDDT